MMVNTLNRSTKKDWNKASVDAHPPLEIKSEWGQIKDGI